MPTVINSYLQDGAKSWLPTLISERGEISAMSKAAGFPISQKVKEHKIKRNTR